MVEVACQCGEGFGLAHSHISAVVHFHNGDTIRTADQWGDWHEHGWVRLWVNWKTVAKTLIKGETCDPVTK